MKNQQAKSPKEILYERYGDLFDFARETVKKNPKVLHGQNCNTLSKGIILFHSIRATYLLSTINLLCEEGYAIEAMPLLRSLLNLVINIKWLTAEDSEARMERFKDFEIVFKKLSIDASKASSYILDEEEEEKSAELNEKFEIIKEKYGLKTFRSYREWSGKSIYQMAKDVGLKKDYKIVYGRLSEVEHTAPNAPGEYLEWGKNGECVMYSGPRDKKTALVLISVLSYFYRVKEITHVSFKLDQDKLDKEKKKLVELANKYWSKKDS